VATFIGNGTMTVPDTGETINMTNNGTAFISFVPGYADTVSAYGREYVFSEDDNDTTAITFNEIIRYDPATFEGKGLVIAVFDNNATGSLVNTSSSRSLVVLLSDFPFLLRSHLRHDGKMIAS
jgi:hypothetical protein